MSNSHDVISALLDERPFDLRDLAATLEEPEGRALLIDLLALRRIVQPGEAIPSMPSGTARGWSWRPIVAAAAVVVALAGGYLAGAARAPAVAESAAPAPTRIVHATSTSQDFSDEVRR